jgi:hypothetical protein
MIEDDLIRRYSRADAIRRRVEHFAAERALSQANLLSRCTRAACLWLTRPCLIDVLMPLMSKGLQLVLPQS